ncbi:MAG: hypothetical protein NC180_11525 [Muribaculaceae bacterium]|nr:hypothetical protein [Roseburia sp.]MCM1493840.1 hypothetical protein [Muribaculaceae bacterium]
MNYDINIEIREAIAAGEQSLYSLREAGDYLNSAGNWGIVDILGGGLITSFIKHSKLNNARQCMESARQDLWRFRQELNDVGGSIPDVQMGDFLTFADFFFDGLIADVLVQSKIDEAKNQVSSAIWQVESILNRLRAELGSD